MNIEDLTGKNFSGGSYREPIDSPTPVRKDFLKTETKTLPSKLGMAASLTKSLSKTAKSFIAGGDISADVSLRKKRAKICEGCAWYMSKSQRCAKCGCFVPLKSYFKEEACPVGKW